MKINPWKVSTLVLTAALALSFATGPATSAPQPMMKKALASLRTAKKQLEAATADKGGHRVKALEHAKKALEETREGIKFDNKN